MERKRNRPAPILLLLSLAVLAGCNGAAPPKNPAAENFRKEVEASARRMVPLLVEPMTRGDRGAVRRILSSERTKALSEQNAVLMQTVVLDPKGVVFECDIPFVCDTSRDYSRIDLVRGALKGKAGSHGKIYTANNREAFIVLTPISLKGEKEGLLGLVYDADRLLRERGVTEKEFLAMHFSH